MIAGKRRPSTWYTRRSAASTSSTSAAATPSAPGRGSSSTTSNTSARISRSAGRVIALPDSPGPVVTTPAHAADASQAPATSVAANTPTPTMAALPASICTSDRPQRPDTAPCSPRETFVTLRA